MRGKKLSLTFFWISFGVAALFLWTAAAEREAHYTPEYEKIDLQPLLEKEVLSEEDYEIIFCQTGLAKAGVEELYEEGRQMELLYLQQRFFEPVEYECCRTNVICRSERLTGSEPEETGGQQDSGSFLPAAHTGDILVTFSGHIFGWRSGHAGIVVDGEAGLTLEAINIGCNSELCGLENWKEYPCFVLLRLKNSSGEEAEAIASYAAEYLTDIPYDLASFAARGRTAFAEPAGEGRADISGTQCAHLVWTAFYAFGYDLDSDGGFVVTPADLYESDFLEVVQVYGIRP